VCSSKIKCLKQNVPSCVAAIGILIPLKDTTAIEGTKAVLEAKISAQDVTSVKWYHNEKLMMPSERINVVAKGSKQRLVFTRTWASDEGQYKLVVGRVDTSCRLTVQRKLHKAKQKIIIHSSAEIIVLLSAVGY